MSEPKHFIPDEWPPAPDDFTGPCIIEVTWSWRSGRGRYWRENGHGYANDIADAGIFDAVRAHNIGANSERSTVVDAAEALTVALAAAEERAAMIRNTLATIGVSNAV